MKRLITLKASFIGLFLSTCILVFSQPGSIDPSFNPIDIGFGNGDGPGSGPISIITQTDGKILISGGFTTYNGVNRSRIARLNVDGTLDNSFNPSNGPNSFIESMVLQPDGKILIGGLFTSYNGVSRNSIARLNTDGSLDTSFNPGLGADDRVVSIALQTNGKIIIGGFFTTYNGVGRNGIARLNSDGSLDTSFDPGTGANNWLQTVVIQSDGKILIGGRFTSYNGIGRSRLARLNSDGSLDTSFDPGPGANNIVFSIALQQDGKILIGGSFTEYDVTFRNRLARLNSDGTLDISFDTGSGASNAVYTIKPQPDGKILIGGTFFSYNGLPSGSFVRLNSNGAFDTSFNSGSSANGTVNSISTQLDGTIFIGGSFTSYNNLPITRLARLNTDGSADTTFGVPGTGVNGVVRSLELQGDGKSIIVGDFSGYNGVGRNGIARLNLDGSLDSSFDPGLGSNSVGTIAVLNDGKIMIGGFYDQFNGVASRRVSRLNSDGSVDPSFDSGFGPNQGINELIAQPDGKVFIVGQFSSYDGTAQNRIARLNIDGTLDLSFNIGAGPDNFIVPIALQSDGRLIVAGGFTNFNGTARNRVARLNTDGSVDNSFDPGLGANGTIYSVAIQQDGKVLISGSFTEYNGVVRNRIARLNSDGSLDSSFDPVGGPNAFNGVDLLLQPDGKIIIGGFFSSYNGTFVSNLARLNEDGSLDTSFDSGSGPSSIITDMVLQADGKVLIVGQFTSYDGTGRNRIARVNGLPLDSDGDGDPDDTDPCPTNANAFLDDCGTCVGGDTGLDPCASADLVLTPSASSVTQCEEFTVLVSVETDDTYNLVEAQINFDPAALQAIDVTAPDGSNVFTANPPFDQPGSPVTQDNTNGFVAYTAGATTDITGSTDFIRITFEVIGTGGTTSITPITTGSPRSRIVFSDFVGGIPVATDILNEALEIDFTLNPDMEDPTFTCISAPSRNTDPGVCTYTAQGTEFDPTGVSDNCEVATISNNINGSATLDGVVFNGGENVIWTVTDVNGNDATCTFTIGVVDNEDPTISCPADQTVSVDASCQAVMPDYTGLATANDNCSVVVTQSPAAGTALNLGTTEVTLTATDPSNNDADCSFNVVVIDDEVPTLTCPDDITVELSTAPDPFVTGMATGSDNCGFTISYEDDDSGLTGCNGTGVLVRTFTITDDSGNEVSCPQNITIQDTEAPEAPICPADISQSVDAGECSAVVNFSAPGSVLDNKYVEDFENPDFVSGDGLPFLGWNNYGSNLSRVTSGTDGISSPDGLAHAVIDTNNSAGFTGAFSRLGGYSAAFGEGYRAQADVYIDLSDPGVSSDTYGWDLSVASSNQDTSHLRDFIFHAASNAAGNVLIGGSNNTNFTRRNDIATLNHYEITTSGWYTFEWVFRDNGSDVLAVDLNLIDDAGTVLWTETRSNPADVISTIVGGNRYMWFTFLEVETLAIDDVRVQRNVATTCDAADGDTFSVGTTTITCNATDACDNAASCSFEVTVTDDEVPTLTCPDDITVELSTAPDPFVTGMATGSDNCGFTISYEDDDSGLTGCNGTGVLVRTFTITDDSGNAVSCPQNITIQDTEAPEAPICPADISQSVDAGECSAVVNFSAPGSVLDNKYVEDFENPDFVSGDGLPFLGWNNYGSDLSRVVTGTNGIASPDGVAHARIDTNNSAGFTGAFSRLGGYSAAFGEGYRAQADVYIDLSDPGVSSDTYGWDLSVASSNQDTSHLRDFIFHAASNAAGNVLIGGSNNTNFTRRNDIATLNHYEITTSGWYTFEWVFRDNGSDVLAVDLNLIDDAGTVLWTETRSNPADVISTIVGGNRYMWFTFLEVETLAIDDVRVQRNVATTCDAADGDTFNVGTTTITCNATDACDNAASCSFEVTVTDDELPTIACPGPQTASSDANCQVALADYTSLATAGDNCSFVVTQSPAPGTLVGLGTTAVTLTVADASNNEADCSFDVVVTDDTDPILTCPTDIIVSNDPNQCGAVVSFAATATDNCAASPTITYSPSSGSTFQVGTTTVTVTADDGNENTSTCTFTVTVNDTEDPVITCAGDATVTINQTNDTYLASGGEFDPTSVSDNCPGVTVSHDASLQPGTSGTDTESLDGWEFPVGTTTITFTATDVAGNTTDCVVIVTVENAVVTGTLVLNTLCLERDMKVTIYETGTAILAGTFNGVLIDSNGDFSFVATGITPGNYDVYLKPEDYLTKMVEDVTIGSTPATISATAFAPGDIDAAEDDQINGNDLSLIIGAYNTEDGIDAAYNSEADINCDGFVDALDLSLLIFFFFDEGDSPN